MLIYRYMFDYANKEAEELKSIQKEDVINWYKTYLRQSSPKCRRLAIRVWGCNTDLKEAEAQPESVKVIKDLAAFKMSSEFYPSICWKITDGFWIFDGNWTVRNIWVLLFTRFYVGFYYNPPERWKWKSNSFTIVVWDCRYIRVKLYLFIRFLSEIKMLVIFLLVWALQVNLLDVIWFDCTSDSQILVFLWKMPQVNLDTLIISYEDQIGPKYLKFNFLWNAHGRVLIWWLWCISIWANVGFYVGSDLIPCSYFPLLENSSLRSALGGLFSYQETHRQALVKDTYFQRFLTN